VSGWQVPRRVGLLAAFVAVVSATSCTPSVGSPAPVTWTIPAGQHEATGSTLALTSADTLSFAVRFDASAVYQTVDPQNQLDVNKLRGMSDCGHVHDVDSARFGWRWTGSAIEITAYVYNAGSRSWVVLGYVQPGEWHDMVLEVTPGGYRFALDGVVTTRPRACTATGLTKYSLWPYFGGTEVAPHTVTLQLLES